MILLRYQSARYIFKKVLDKIDRKNFLYKDPNISLNVLSFLLRYAERKKF